MRRDERSRARPIRVSSLLLVTALAMAGCGGGEEGPATPAEPTLALSDCLVSSPDGGRQFDARCGTLPVPEDRRAAEGRRIDLNVAVVPAVSRSPEPDPLFLLAGGPGQAATEAFPPILFAFDRLRQDRDIVLVDQRGTGASNPLDCPPLDEADASLDPDTEAVRSWARACLQRLEEQADPRQYTTALAVTDLEEVRRALGYERMNLYGGSYGTRVALEYARRHPERVRTMVLDGVVPPDLALGTTVARDAQGALDTYLDRCADEPDCRAAFPDLREGFASLLASLDRPRTVTIEDPHTGLPTEVRLDRETVAGTLRFLSYAPETASLLPLLVHAAAREDDLGPLAAQVRLLEGQAAEALSIGMHFSVICAEDVAYFDERDLELHNADTYLADLLTGRLTDVCAVWPRAEIPDDFKTPVAVDVPTLVLSGEVDPVTPPEYGESVAGALPSSLHLVAAGQGHGVVFRGCIPQIVRAFVESGTPSGLDTDCLTTLSAPPFFVSPSGPVPPPETPSDGEGGAP